MAESTVSFPIVSKSKEVCFRKKQTHRHQIVGPDYQSRRNIYNAIN